jgi:hypothetical protein
MSKQLSTLLLIGLLSVSAAFAQNDADALRYSMLNYGSTARSLAMGNSFGALGADFSSLSMNPAGIGLYRHSEFSISPVFSNTRTNAEYIGQNGTDDFFKFAFGNIGVVWASTIEKNGDPWKGIAFGIGYNQTNNFSGRTFVEAGNARNSMLDSYLEDLNGVYPDEIPYFFPYDVDLAWQTYLIDTVQFGGSSYYYSALPFAGALQRRSTETRGGQGEWDFTLGGNLNNTLYLGFTLGLTTIRYEEESVWEEVDDQDTIPFFAGYRYIQSLSSNGSGINVKFGAIYRPTDAMRIGLAVHSPTWNEMVDDYSTTMRADLEDGTIRDYSGPVFIPFDYSINTPFRTIASLGLIIAQQGALNIDYEFTDYSMARIRPQDKSFTSDFAPVNNAIRQKYTSAHQVRAGFEWRYDVLRFRLGAQYATSPFEKSIRGDQNTDMSRMGFSGGLGYRGEKYYFDAAYAWARTGSFLQPYTLNSQATEGISYTRNDGRVMLTFGYLF